MFHFNFDFSPNSRPSAWRTSLQTWRAASCCRTGREPSSARQTSSSPWTPWTACPHESPWILLIILQKKRERKQTGRERKTRDFIWKSRKKNQNRDEGWMEILLWWRTVADFECFLLFKEKCLKKKHCSVLLLVAKKKNENREKKHNARQFR